MLRTLRFEWIAVVAVSCSTISVTRLVVNALHSGVWPIGTLHRQHGRAS
jgi:hypothetical protein